MKHFKLTFLLTILMSMVGAKSFAHDFAVANDDGVTIYYVWTNNKTEVAVSYKGYSYEYNEYTGNIVIPESVTYSGTTYSVTSIGNEAFRYCTGLTSIKIPNSVTSIGGSAFSNCTGLTSIEIPNSVTSIDDYAFGNTAWYNNQPDGLIYAGKVAYKYKGTMPDNTSITIKDGTLGIAGIAFYNCTGLTSIEIPASVTSIGGGAFSGCSGLTSVKVPVTDYSAFCNNKVIGLIVSTIKKSVKLIDKDGNEIKEYVIPKDVTSIGDKAFQVCAGLTSIEIPNSVTSIDNSAFSGCSGLTSIEIPNSVTSIGYSAFRNCSGLTSITIGNSVTSIGSYAFCDCSGLTSIEIPNSVTSIGSYAFSGCSGLTSVKVPVTDYSAFCNNKVVGLIASHIGKPVELIDKDGNEIKEYVIPKDVTSIGDYAFYACSGLTSIEIPNSVTSIGYSAFSGCSGLTSVTFHCKEIGSWFSGTSIKEVIIGDEVTSIGKYAFSGCSGLTSITIPNSVTSIGSYAFSGCSGLTSIEIPNSVTSIGTEAFRNCSGLTSIKIPNNVTSIGGGAFKDCSGLLSVVIGNGVKDLPSEVFATGNSLMSLTIGSAVLSINSYAFSDRPVKTIWMTNTPPVGYTYAGGTVNYVANDLYSNLSDKTIYPFLSSLFEVDGVRYVPVSPSERTCHAIDCTYNESAENINIGKSVSYQGIAMTVKEVNPYACYQNPFITEVSLAYDGDLGDCAFQRCTGIIKAVVNNQGAIASKAFFKSLGLKTIEVGTNVTDIGDYAFSGCTQLETAKMQNQGAIGNNAFENNTAMTAATLGKKITSIGQNAFSNCSALKKMVIPNAVKTLGAYAFSDCSSMASAKIGTSVITIGSGAFSGCSALPQIVIPQSVTTVNNYVFQGCTSLTNVNMEERKSDKTVLTLGSNDNKPLFADCPLDEVYIGRNISYSTESYRGYSPFYRNTSLRSVTITDRETEISMNEFYGCTNLQDVTIGDGVESFGDWAFSGCSSLKHFSFGMNVEKIGREAFSDCTSMESIFSRSPEPPVCGDQALDDINKWICTLTVPAGNKAAYMAADQWKEFYFIEEGDAVKKYFDISIEANEGGRVLVNDKEESKVSMKKGSDVVLRFTPEEGHTLKQVLVNGEDVTSQVVDGCYTLTEISADMTIKVVFSDTSGISTIKADDEDVKWYTLDGHRIDAPRKGLNIVRMSNGKTKKVLVK